MQIERNDRRKQQMFQEFHCQYLTKRKPPNYTGQLSETVTWYICSRVKVRLVWTEQGCGKVKGRSTQDIHSSLSVFGRDLRVELHCVSK